MTKHIILLTFIININCLFAANETLQTGSFDEPIARLAEQFMAQPDMQYRPYVWWHWMGSNFSKEGITKDLEAMAEAGIGGATIFNIASAVQESHKPTENNPWPEQTYRSKAYWDALHHAAAEAKRLGLKIGIHNSPGYSTTGGPWVTEEKGMQKLVFSQQELFGGQEVTIHLARPELPVYSGWGSTRRRASYYQDIAVMAIPEKADISEAEVLDISNLMQNDGTLTWNAPSGKWTVVRIGHAPTMSNPHPLPDDIIGKALEVDKMSREANEFHWNNMLEPLKEHLADFIGDSFDHILIDSYEAGNQNWTKSFRSDFERLKGYDPLPIIALIQAGYSNNRTETFKKDQTEVIGQLFLDNGWKIAHKMINDAGLAFYWEPYWGPFSTYACTPEADLPMGEFWSSHSGRIPQDVVNSAAHSGKRIVGAEAFTGDPRVSKYTEDPAFLKPSADGSLVSGTNRMFLHHWVHQPFDDKYQPGMGMGWWGTHFGRHQTWQKPGRAFFNYLSRCQMMLQQGAFVKASRIIQHRSATKAEIYFIINPEDSVVQKDYALTGQYSTTPELWDAYRGSIEQSAQWKRQGDSLYVTLKLNPHESRFVIIPHTRTDSYAKDKEQTLRRITSRVITGSWSVELHPKLMQPFRMDFPELIDFSTSSDDRLKYFSGTAIYRKPLDISRSQLKGQKHIVLDFGQLHDIAELYVNGKHVMVLWNPPYQADVTPYLHKGKNQIELHVTNNWANRLIGDEQYPADFEWGEDRGERGHMMKGYPEWFLKGEPRPEQNRKAFLIWYYHRADSPLSPAGLLGPVNIIESTVE